MYVELNVYALLISEIVVFWNISRNRLAGRSWPPSGSSLCSVYWVFQEEPPDDKFLTVRQRQATRAMLARFVILCILEWFWSGENQVVVV